MSAERDVNRIVRSWLREGEHESADAILGIVLSGLDTAPQRRSWWPARRSSPWNTYAKLAAAAAAVLLVAVVGYNLLPRIGGFGGRPTATPSLTASSTPLAVGSFISHGGRIELSATGEGANVTGSMTYTYLFPPDSGGFVVDLACTQTTDRGLIVIGGPVTESTKVDGPAPKGSNVAIVLQRGSPVEAEFWFEHPRPHEDSCPAFLASIPDLGDPGRGPQGLEPISGTLEVRP